MQTKFIIRLKRPVFEKEIKRMKTNDEFVKINLKSSRLFKIQDPEIKEFIKNKPYINLRITKIKLDSGEEEILISNLSKDKFTTKDLNNLYEMRWKIEIVYDFLKNVINIENFTGYSTIIVKQDFYASILFYNISMAIKLHSEEKLKFSNKLKINQAINFNVTAGIVKIEIENLLYQSKIEEINETLETMIEYLEKQLITINTTARKDMEIKTSDIGCKFHINKRVALL